METPFTLYVVQTQDGKYVRSGGSFGGPLRKMIVDKIENAKIYTKIGQAKSRITSLFKRWPQFGCCSLVELTIAEESIKVISMEESTKNSIEKMKKSSLKKEIRYKKRQIDSLKERLTEEERELLGLNKE